MSTNTKTRPSPGHPPVTLDAKGSPTIAPGHALTLSERFVGNPGRVYICDPACVQKDPYYIGKGEMVDGQDVFSGGGYTLERRWFVDGQPAGVLNDKNQVFDYEILHASNESNEPFQIEYSTDPKQ